MSLLDLFFPKHCIICNRPTISEAYICESCVKFAEFSNGSLCCKCGRLHCMCGRAKVYFDYIVSPFFYSGEIRHSILNLKKYQKFCYAYGFAYHMKNEIIKIPDIDKIDLITYIPAYKSYQRERGYNQSLLLADCLSKFLNIDVSKKVIKKIKETESQHDLNGRKRKHNLIGAFEANKEIANGKNILLVDDVMTTGSTLNICSKELKNAGARKVYCAVISSAENPNGYK